MEIKVGKKYKRVKCNVNSSLSFIGQIVTVTGVKYDAVWFSKTTKEGWLDDGCCQELHIFKQNFTPLIVSLENK